MEFYKAVCSGILVMASDLPCRLFNCNVPGLHGLKVKGWMLAIVLLHGSTPGHFAVRYQYRLWARCL